MKTRLIAFALQRNNKEKRTFLNSNANTPVFFSRGDIVPYRAFPGTPDNSHIAHILDGYVLGATFLADSTV